MSPHAAIGVRQYAAPPSPGRALNLEEKLFNMKFRPFLMALAALCVTTRAYAAPDDLNSRTRSLETHVNEVAQAFTLGTEGSDADNIQDRLNQGMVLQAAGDYERAGYVYMGIVSREAWRGQPAYETAGLYLAQTLYERGYYRLTEEQLLKRLYEMRSGAERNQAIELLIKTVQRTQNWDTVTETLQKHGETLNDPGMLYALGRSFFLQDRDDEAQTALAKVNDGGAWGVKAAYLRGALFIRAKQLDAAQNMFQIAAQNKAEFRDADTIRILANLALARIAYENKNWGEAVHYYQLVPETSEYFGDVLYEMAWTHIKLENYLAAKQSFELLMMTYPKHRRALDTRHFLATIQKELGNYDEAMNAYQQLVSKYEPVMDQMASDATNLDEKKRLVKQQVQNGEYDSIVLLPEAARDVVSDDEHMLVVENVLGSLEQTDVNTTESEQIIAEIESIIQSPENIRALPQFRKHANAVRDVYLEALYLGVDLTREYSTLAPGIEEDLLIADSLPRSQQERDIIASKQVKALEERAARFHRIQLNAENTRHRLKIVQNWMRSSTNNSLSDEERDSLNSQLAALEKRLAQLHEAQTELEARLSTLRITSVNGSHSGDDAVGALVELRRALAEQWNRDLARKDVDDNYRELVLRLKRVFERVNTLESELELAVSAKSEDLHRQLTLEKSIVAAEKARYAQTQSEVSETAGEVAATFWADVYYRIRDLVMDADLGMVDIAWIRKDARTRELNNIVEERKKEKDVLKQDFKQYLEEENQKNSN